MVGEPGLGALPAPTILTYGNYIYKTAIAYAFKKYI